MAQAPSEFSIPGMIEAKIDGSIKPGLLNVKVNINVQLDLQGIIPTTEELDAVVQLYKSNGWGQVRYTEFSGPDGNSGQGETVSVDFILKAR